MATNAITTQIRIDADAAIKALKNVEAGFDGTESSAQRAAAQIDAMTDVIRANAQQAKTSGDALATALGPDFVSDLERAGGSVDGLVADLRKAGVTFEDMAADADALAASLKRAQDAGNELGTNVSRAASDAESGLTRVAHAGDNSRSVLANMVGNSVQDLGALGGVAGSAGMAIGQLAEYATEGNISLAGLAGVAGPMIGVASAVAGVVYVMGQLQQAAADVTAEIETLKGVRLDIATGNTADAAAKLAEQYANTVPLLEKYGYSALALTDTLAGNGDVIEALIPEALAAGHAASGLGEADAAKRLGVATVVGKHAQRQMALDGVLQDRAQAAGIGKVFAQMHAHGAGLGEQIHLGEGALVAGGRSQHQEGAFGSLGALERQADLGVGVDGRFGEGLEHHGGEPSALANGTQESFLLVADW
jgi:hypothetical protein